MTGVRYLSPQEAAGEVLGWVGEHRGQKLLRLILRREKVENREIATRTRTEGTSGPRYLVTEATLRLHFPELFMPQIDAIAIELARKVDELRETIGATVDERLAPQIEQLRTADRRLAQEVTRLAESTNEGFRRTENRIKKLEERLNNNPSESVTHKL